MKVAAPPRSDQWNAEDFTGGPRTFTIADVKPGKAEQKYDIELVEGEGRVWRPPLTVLRLLIAAWSDEAETWRGRRVTLYLDPEIKFGPDKVGGIRVSHLSGIDEPLTVALSVKRGRRTPHTVLPLVEDRPKDTSGRDWLAELAMAGDDSDAITALGIAAKGSHADPAVLAVIRKRLQDVRAGSTEEGER